MHISFLKKKKIVEWICGNGIAKIGGKKKLLHLVCDNDIAEIEGGKKRVAIDLRKKKLVYGNGIATITTNPSYFCNDMATNQLQKKKKNFLLFRQCQCHKSIPQFFFFFRNDMCTQLLQYFYNKF